MASSIVQTFEKVSFDHPERTAVYGVSEGQTRTFRQLHDDMRMISRGIAAMPLPAGPCIVCSVGNRVGFIPLILAGLEANAALVLLDGDGPLSHVLAIAGRLGAHAVVVGADMASSSAPTIQPLPGGLHMLLVDPCEDAVWRHDLAQGPVILKMTSGSSDRPRAVIATEANLLSDGRHIIEAMDIRCEDVSLGVIPLAHSYGLGNLVMPLLIQGSAIVLREGFAPRQLERDVRACGVTIVPAVPYFFEHLRRSKHSEALASVRLLVTAGAPILFETTAFFKQVIGRKIHSFYGSSETGGISFDDSEEVSRPLTVGRPMPGTKVDLKPCWNSQKGEGRVFVRGAAVASGYAGAPPADEADPRFVDGGFLTADVGTFDSLGRLVLIGRMSRLINVAGRKVDPVEVEAVLRSLPGVVEVSVIGVPCTTRGEQVAACISRQDEQLSVADVRAYCASRLAAYKVPRQIVFVEVLPVDARGKIDRRAIGALVCHNDEVRHPRV